MTAQEIKKKGLKILKDVGVEILLECFIMMNLISGLTLLRKVV